MRGRGGSVVMVSSLSGVAGAEKFPGMSAYVATKSGLAGLVEALAVEGRPDRIRVNAVSRARWTRRCCASRASGGPKLEPDQVARVILVARIFRIRAALGCQHPNGSARKFT